PGPLLPNISRSPFLYVCLLEDPLAGGLHDVVREPLERQQDPACVAYLLRRLARPDVLPNEERGRGVRLETLGDIGEGVLVEEAANLDADLVECRLDPRIELVELHRNRVARLVLADEGDVDDANGSGVDELADCRRNLAGELVPWEPDDHVV